MRDLADQQYQQSQVLRGDYLNRVNPMLDTAQNQQQQAFQEALGYRNKAGGQFDTLSGMGLSDREAGMRNFFDTLLPLFAGVTGLPATNFVSPASVLPSSPAGGAYNRTPLGTGGAAEALNNRNRPSSPNSTIDPRVSAGPLAVGDVGANTSAGGLYVNTGRGEPASNIVPGAASASGGQHFDPYALTSDQQVQLNSQVDAINAQKQSALNDLRASFAQRGISDPRAMAAAEQMLADRFDTQSSQSKAAFGETARANRERAVSTLMDFFNNLMGQGSQNFTTGAQGNLALGNQAQGAGESQQQAALSLLAQLGNLSTGSANDANQMFSNAANASLGANSMGMDAISGALQLLGYGLGGGFNRPKRKTVGNT